MISSLLLLLVLLAALALIWWGINQLTLPTPVKVIVLVAVGLIALAVVYKALMPLVP